MIWFDLDDTLWAMTENSSEVLRGLHKDISIISAAFPDNPERWLDVYHTVNGELWTAYAAGDIDRDFLRRERFARPLEIGGIAPEKAAEAADMLDGVYLDRLGACSGMLPGAMEFLERFAKACPEKPGIISNGFKEVQHRKMESAGIRGYFSTVVLSDDAGVNKPDRRLFDYALELTGTRAEDSVIVGDNPVTDIFGALRAGWARAIWYNPRETETPEILAPYTDRLTIVKDFDGMFEALTN